MVGTRSYGLPTLDKLQATVPPNLDAKKIVSDWFQSFVVHVQSGNIDGIIHLFVEDAYWRDLLALTWEFRTFVGASRIRQFLHDRIPCTRLQSLKLKDDFLGLQQPYPDLAWIMALFEFETDVACGSGIFRLVPTASGEWKAHCMFTNLENLKGFPEKIGELRDHATSHFKWAEKRRREVEFEDRDPAVLIVGGGQTGLEVAARLKVLGVSNLVIEKHPRIGDSWRNRYEAMCLHDPVWYHHMPYLPFPPSWPVFPPVSKLADWLESYANTLDLNVWTSATVASASQDVQNKWTVTVKRDDGRERVFKVNHIVFATGFGAGVTPSFPEMDKFKGEMLHSTQYSTGEGLAGRKVVVIGACTSGHDIAADCFNHGIDVTMVQRSSTYVMGLMSGWGNLGKGYVEGGPPIDIADRISASFPYLFFSSGLFHRITKKIADDDREILDGLQKRGFRTNMGPDGKGLFPLVFDGPGGYYINDGASQLIIDGKIKLKNDSDIRGFTADGLEFADGSLVPADVVVFATGLGDPRDAIGRVCGEEVMGRCKRVWGLDDEGEVVGNCRDLGVPGLWYIMGNLAMCRFHSKHLALQIKAMEEGVFGTRYA